jgi:hypothetical protein
MFCCELKSTVEDLASGRVLAALNEVKQKSILGNAYILTRCANPFGIENMVIIERQRQNRTEVYWCGELVFLWDCGLKRYICGDWTDTLTAQVEVIKTQRRQVKAIDKAQTLANNSALRNYVMC